MECVVGLRHATEARDAGPWPLPAGVRPGSEACHLKTFMVRLRQKVAAGVMPSLALVAEVCLLGSSVMHVCWTKGTAVSTACLFGE
jgi:hypothetical protein